MAPIIDALWSEITSSYTLYVFGAVILAATFVRATGRAPSRRLRTATVLFLLHLTLVVLAASLIASGSGGARWAHLGAVLAASAVGVWVLVLVGFGALDGMGIGTPPIIRELATVALLVGVALMTAKRVGVDVSGLVTTSAVLTAVIGLSLQDTLGNLMAGLVLQSDNSIRVGDWVRVETHTGKIREMRWRYTTIQTRNGEMVFMPNSRLVRGDVTVLGRVGEDPVQWRRWVYFNIDFRFAPSEVIQTVTDSLAAAPIAGVSRFPLPNCVLMSFEESYGRYAVRYWLTDLQHDDPTDSLVRSRVFLALERVSIPLSIPAEARFITKETESRRARKEKSDLEQRKKALARVHFFDVLSDEERAELAKGMTRAPFAPGEVITQRGATAHWLYLVAVGRASVRIGDGDGTDPEVAQLGAGDFFGEMSLLTGVPRQATVIALTDVECYRLDKETFERLLVGRPELAERFANVLAKRQRELDEVVARSTSAADRPKSVDSRALLGMIRDFFGLRG